MWAFAMDLKTRPRVVAPAVVVFWCWLSLGVGTAEQGSHAPTAELRFLTWSEYMDPALLAEFERRFQAKVTEVYFESDDMRDDMLVETDGLEGIHPQVVAEAISPGVEFSAALPGLVNDLRHAAVAARQPCL